MINLACPRCGATLNRDRSEGLCPRCLLDSALSAAGGVEDSQCLPASERSAPSSSALLSATAGPLLSRRLGDYELLAVAGRGGMGVVYKARQLSLNRLVALKLIRAGPLASQASVARFQAEAETVGRLCHPHLVSVFESGELEGLPYLAMDFVQGEDLARHLQRGRAPVRHAIAWVRQAAEAIDYAHEQGVLHRDLKPSNLLLDAAGLVHVTDFGLAKDLREASALTASGALLGTPCYMAPEQAAACADAVGRATDVYALGAILYELITGRPPFRADTPVATMKLVLESDPASPRLLAPEISPELETVCLKCLEKEPGRRYPSACALAEDLGRIERGEPIRARRIPSLVRAWRWTRRHPMPAMIGGTIAACLVLLALGSGLAAWRIALAKQDTERQRQRAEASAALNRERLAHSYVLTGTRFLEEDDPAGSLPWLVAAFAMEQANPDRAAIHRLRLAAVLEQCPRLRQVLVHGSYVNHAEFNPQGTQVVTAGNDRVVRLWEVATGATLGRPMPHSGEVAFAFFSPDGQLIASVSADQTARFWRVPTGEAFGSPLLHDGTVNHGTFNPDGRLFLTASSEGAARVWEVRSGQPASPLLRHEGPVNRAFFSPDGRRVVTAGADGTARVWDASSGQLLLPPLRHRDQVTWAAFSPDGSRLATASADRTAQLWRADTGEPVFPALKHTGPVSQVGFSPDGGRLVTASADRRARVWEARTGELVGLPVDHRDMVIRAIFSPDGRWILTTSQDQTIRLWEADSGQPVSPPMHHNSWVRQAAFSSDGRRIVSVSGDRTAKIWEAPASSPARLVLRQEGQITRVAFSPDGKKILTAGGVRDQFGEASLWEIESGRRGETIRVNRPIAAAVFHPGGHRLVFADQTGEIQMWDLDSRRAVWQAGRQTEPARRFAFSADGAQLLAATGSDAATGWSQLLDASTGLPHSPLFTHTNSVRSAALSPDGRRVLLAAGPSPGSGGDGVVEVRDVASGQVVLGPLRCQRPLLRAVWSPDGQRILTVGGEQTAQLIDARTGQSIGSPMRHVGWLIGASFSPDGRKIVTFGFDQTARLWNAVTGEPLTAAMAHRGVVRMAAFSSDSRLLATVADDHACRVWDASTGCLVTPLLRHRATIRSLAFSPDSRQLLTGCSNGEARLFVLQEDPRSPAELTRWAEWLTGRTLDSSGGLVPLEGEALRERRPPVP